MNTNNKTQHQSLIDKSILIQLSILENLRLYSIEIESGKVNFSTNEFINVRSPKGSILINFSGQNASGKEIMMPLKFKGFSIFDELPLTVDISSFTISLELEKKQEPIFSFTTFELIKDMGVYSFSLKNKIVEMEIDTSFYIVLNNGFTLLFSDVHDRAFDQFYYYQKEDQMDIFKTFNYEEGNFINWNKISIFNN